MSIFKLHTSLFGLTATTLLVTSINFSAFATDVPAETDNISYSAADLLPEADSSNNAIAQRPVDPVQFCRDYPQNSACLDKSPEQGQQEEIEISEPVETESKKKAETSGWGVTPEIGTTGIGVSVTKSVSDNINARVGLNAFKYGVDFEEEEVEYEADLNLFNVSTLVDYHPSKKSGFRVTGGLVFNNNNVSGSAKPNGNQTYEYNGTTYTTDQVRSVDAKISLPNQVAPYLGIGWGNAVKPGNRFAFSLNLGVMFTGSPNVELNADIADETLREQIERDIEAERKEIEDDISGFGVYPVLSIGASYHF